MYKGPEVGVCLEGLQSSRKFTVTEKNERGEDELEMRLDRWVEAESVQTSEFMIRTFLLPCMPSPSICNFCVSLELLLICSHAS